MSQLGEYRRKRNPTRTAEPIPAGEPSPGAGNTFVVQEHHATALHWDFRLERDGVLVSWAVPKGLPTNPTKNHLAVHTEDHPLEYATFAGPITPGEYGGGQVSIWDSGTYETEKWTDNEVKVVLAGGRVRGRFVLFRTGGKNWMIHRMDAPPRPDWLALPEHTSPMLATPGDLPSTGSDDRWAYEMKWDGVRALARVEGGRLRLTSRNGLDMGVAYPELRALAEGMGTTEALLDGEIVSFDAQGQPSFARLQKRMHVANAAAARRLAESDPAVLLIFDLLHLDGESLLKRPYTERRAALDALGLDGPSWHTPVAFVGRGAEAVQISQDQHLEGVVAKRLGSTYRPGHRSPDWVKIKNIRTQEVIIGGWRPGNGRRAGTIGALLLGLPGPDGGLTYIGKVGTGFTAAVLVDLRTRLTRIERVTSPFDAVPRPEAVVAHWVTPQLVGEVAFSEWTPDRRLRHPTWRGLRPEKPVDEVVAES